jgi:mono/diheme cytochrome c family protein
MFMDTVASLVVFAIIVILSVVSPAPLDAKADPNNNQFVASPAWYFTALYYLLEIFPGQLGQFIATLVIPTVAVLFLILLPWIDRNPSREIRRRPLSMAVTALSVVLAVGLSVAGQISINDKAAARGQTAPTVAGGEDAKKIAAAAAGGAGGAGAEMAPGGTSGSVDTAKGGGSAPGAAGSAADLAKGESVYKNNCIGCHQAAGTGAPGAFPPLAGNPHVTGDVKYVIGVIDNGKQGALDVPGHGTYNGVMPAWKSNLKPDEIAAVINYIRNSWGNKGSTVTAAQVSSGG